MGYKCPTTLRFLSLFGASQHTQRDNSERGTGHLNALRPSLNPQFFAIDTRLRSSAIKTRTWRGDCLDTTSKHPSHCHARRPSPTCIANPPQNMQNARFTAPLSSKRRSSRRVNTNQRVGVTIHLINLCIGAHQTSRQQQRANLPYPARPRHSTTLVYPTLPPASLTGLSRFPLSLKPQSLLPAPHQSNPLLAH